jgi:4-amino-4-deoxychorismate lyase
MHKTSNYMHYYLARRDARKHGFDDALLTDEIDHALETSTASLLFSDGKSFTAPDSNAILPGIAIDVARRVIGVTERPVPIESLDDFRYVYVLNSLIGMKPVALIDDIAFPIDTSTSKEITKHILLL